MEKTNQCKIEFKCGGYDCDYRVCAKNGYPCKFENLCKQTCTNPAAQSNALGTATGKLWTAGIKQDPANVNSPSNPTPESVNEFLQNKDNRQCCQNKGETMENEKTFSEALELIKTGARMMRQGWNGKNMFVFLVHGSTFKVNRPPLLGIYPEGTEINYHGHIDMRTADGMIVPWLASQTDVLAEDWLTYSE